MVYLLFTNSANRRHHEALVREAKFAAGSRDNLFVFDWGMLPTLGRMFDICEVPTLVHDELAGGHIRKLTKFNTVEEVAQFMVQNDLRKAPEFQRSDDCQAL